MRSALTTRIVAALARANETTTNNAVAPIDAAALNETGNPAPVAEEVVDNAARVNEPELVALLAAAALALDSSESRTAAIAAIDALLTHHESSRAQLVDATLAIALIAQSPTLPPPLRARCLAPADARSTTHMPPQAPALDPTRRHHTGAPTTRAARLA